MSAYKRSNPTKLAKDRAQIAADQERRRVEESDKPLEEDLTPFSLIPTGAAARGFALAKTGGVKTLLSEAGALGGAGARAVGRMHGVGFAAKLAQKKRKK